jgi:hypothetical protein
MPVLILAETVLMSDPISGPFYRTNYEFTEPVNGVVDGAVDTPITADLTETTFNATVSQACADKANLEASTTQFSAASVRGGRV